MWGRTNQFETKVACFNQENLTISYTITAPDLIDKFYWSLMQVLYNIPDRVAWLSPFENLSTYLLCLLGEVQLTYMPCL